MFWHHHFGKIAAGWAVVFLVPFAFGAGTAFGTLVHALLEEYIPFIVLLTALYTVAGGICVNGNLRHAEAEHRDPRARHAARERDGHHGRRDAADPAAAAPTTTASMSCVVIFFIFLVANAAARYRRSAIRRCSSVS